MPRPARLLKASRSPRGVPDNATWCKDEIARRGKCGDGYRGGVGRYFLEGPRALLDQAEEWSFEQNCSTRECDGDDVESSTQDGGQLFLWAPGGVDPTTLGDTLRAKTQTYAFDVRNSSFITFTNMSFFATSLQAYDDRNETTGANGTRRDSSTRHSKRHREIAQT